MLHKIMPIGFVDQEPQVRDTQEDTPITNFSVATRS
jgi:hypothetical protein